MTYISVTVIKKNAKWTDRFEDEKKEKQKFIYKVQVVKMNRWKEEYRYFYYVPSTIKSTVF